ncbi:ORF6C domain-containing protein [[Clostridium] innocuum]|nr:ORF6C domain-containing protein [[Clostridium] innocuum]
MAEQSILTFDGVHCYLEADGTAYLKLEDVARGLGFTTVATSGNEVIRWSRVRKYLQELNTPTCGDTDYIPEQVFYMLAMKANNEAAKEFQRKIAYEIIPEIRKTGCYSNTENGIIPMGNLSTEMQALLMHDRKLVEQDKRIAVLEDNTLISTRQRRKIRNAIHSAVASACGGIKTAAYKENSKRVYKAVYNFLYDHYDISEYADIPKVKYNEALSLIENWYPSYDLQLSIDISNNCKQQKMDLDED